MHSSSVRPKSERAHHFLGCWTAYAPFKVDSSVFNLDFIESFKSKSMTRMEKEMMNHEVKISLLCMTLALA